MFWAFGNYSLRYFYDLHFTYNGLLISNKQFRNLLMMQLQLLGLHYLIIQLINQTLALIQ